MYRKNFGVSEKNTHPCLLFTCRCLSWCFT